MYDPGSDRAGAVAAFMRAVGTVLAMVGHDDIRASDHSCSAGVSLMPVGAWSWVNPAMSAALNILFVSSSIRWWMRFRPMNFDHAAECASSICMSNRLLSNIDSPCTHLSRRDVSCVRFIAPRYLVECCGSR